MNFGSAIGVPILVSMAVAAAVTLISYGLLRYNADHARGIKQVELLDDHFVRHIAAIRMVHPEIVRVARIDRHPFYLLVAVAMFCYSMCVFGGAKLTSNVSVLEPATRYTMATCFTLGSTMMLVSSAMGVKIGKRYFMRRIADHPTCNILGDNIVVPYILGRAGLATIAIASEIYSATSFTNTTGSLGGWLTFAVAVASATCIAMMWQRTRSFEREDETLLSEAIKRRAQADGQACADDD